MDRGDRTICWRTILKMKNHTFDDNIIREFV